jgi:thiol-disulfide isomerase/thioredoxin
MKKLLKYLFFFAIVIIFNYPRKNLDSSKQVNHNNFQDKNDPVQTKNNIVKNTPAEKNEKIKPVLKKEIIEIKDVDTLLAAFTKKEPTVIMGTMDGCSHCKHVIPTFQSYSSQFPLINFLIVNGPQKNMGQLVYKETNNTIAIRGYPAFIFIRDGKIQDCLLGTNIEQLEHMLGQLEQ